MAALIDQLEAKFFDHRIRQHLAGDTLNFLLRLLTTQPVQLQHEEFSLPDILHRAMPQRGKRVLNGLALRIKDRSFGHHPDVSFHRGNYTGTQNSERRT